MKTELGGERLGSGAKMEIIDRTFERSNHDLSETLLTTASVGTLIPFICVPMKAGDAFDIELYIDAMTHPTLGPLFNGFKIQLDMFKAPIRFYNPHVTMDAVNLGKMMNEVKLPLMGFEGKRLKVTDAGNIDNAHISPSCLLSYLYVRGLGNDNGTDEAGTIVRRYFNATFWIMYHEIGRNYYANKQEGIGYVIHNDLTANDYTSATGVYTNMFGTKSLTNSETMTGGTTAGMWLEPTATLHVDFVGLVSVNPQDVYMSWGTTWRRCMSVFQAWEWDGNRLIFSNPRNFAGSAPWFEITVGYIWIKSDFSDIAETSPNLKDFPLENVDTLRKRIMAGVTSMNPFLMDKDTMADLKPYNFMFKQTDKLVDGHYIYSKESSQEGLLVKTYQADLFNNWLDTEAIDGDNGVNELTKIIVEDDAIKVDQILTAYKVYKMMNDINIGGGSTKDWYNAVHDESGAMNETNPSLVGGLSTRMVFQEITSQAAGANGQPLGTIGGKGVLVNERKGGKIYVKAVEHQNLMGIFSITPYIVYSQGNAWFNNLKTWDDYHKPPLDRLGFQDLTTDQMAWWDTGINPTSGQIFYKSAGKQPAWINYMTSVNRALGNLAIPTSEMFMTNNRQYKAAMSASGQGTDVQIQDLTTYIDPVKFNQIFAYTALDAQNFWVQITTKIFARRKMSATQIPNL